MSSNKNSSNENSLIFDQQNSEKANDLNSKASNLAEPSFSNGDRDDSLYDALSIDAQTPFKIEQSNIVQESELTRANLNNLNNYKESLKTQDTNRFSFVDFEFVKNNKQSINLESRTDQTDLMLDLKDTSIDEILLIADDTHTAREPISTDKQFMSKNSVKIDLQENFPKKTTTQTFQNLYDSPQDSFNLNETRDYKIDLNEKEKNRTNLQRLKDRINAINLNDKRLDDGLEIMKTPQPDLVNDDFLGESREKSKNEGAFKLYTTSIEEDLITTARNKDSQKIEKSKTKNISNQKSPFCLLDKQSVGSNDALNKSKRGPIKKYRSGSTSNLSTENKLKNPQDTKKLSNKQNSEQIRPATHNEITYTLDSDESTIIDNLIKNPDRLKQKLKQSRIERDQLNQLQQNYTRLLQQYAEAENFIDAFRLNAQIGGNSSNPTPVAKGSFLTNESKSQTNVGSQQNSTQPLICSSNSTLSSNQLNIEKTNSLNGSRAVLVTDQTNPLVKSISLAKAQSNDNLVKNKDTAFQSQSANNFQQTQDLNKNHSQSTVYVISNKNRSNSGVDTKSPSIDENSRVNSPSVEDNIVIDQTSALGILVQMKVLEDKMQSFVTLVNENQLNKSEQRQVVDSIQNDYQVLIQNFDQVKTSNLHSLVQQQVEMDVDLNEELGKMKALLDNIVHKMNDNLIDATSDYSDLEQKQSFENSSIGSFYDNRDELMGQYNRLLDFFNDEPENKSDCSTNRIKQSNSKQNEQTKSETVCSVSREFDFENSSLSKSCKLEKKKKETIKKKNISEPSESTSELNKDILKNNAKLIGNRSKKEITDSLNKNSLNKKLSRLSVDRVDKFEDSENNILKNTQKKYAHDRNTNNNRRLTKMSNESSTETLTTSENESTKLFSDSKPSFRNYIDEISEDTLEKSSSIIKKKTSKTNENRTKDKSQNLKSNQLKIKSKDVLIKKKEKVEKHESSISEQEYNDHDNTIRYQKNIQLTKPSPSSKKSVSVGNIYEHSKNQKHVDKKSQAKPIYQEKIVDLKNLPIAKAYEGSDSLEDLDSSNPTINDNYEYASSTVVKNEKFKKPDKRTEYLQMKYKQAQKNSSNNLNNEKKKNYEQKYLKNYQQKPRINYLKKHVDDSTYMTSDVESVIEKRRALKTSKRDLMKKLAEEVEFLKQEILKKNQNKSNTSKERKQRLDFANSDTKDQVSDSQINKNKEDKLKKYAQKIPQVIVDVPQKLVKHKNCANPKVLLQKNKNVFVLKNADGRERYFCVIDQDELKEKSNFKSISSNQTIKTINHTDVKNYRFSSVQNLFNLKREDKVLDDYFSDEELDNIFFTDTNLVSNRARSHLTKDRRYLSTNDIFERTSSSRQIDRQSYMSKCPNSVSRDRGNHPLVDYSIPMKKENEKKKQIPIVVGKPISKKSRECLIFLPVNNPDMVNKIPVNLIPYSIKGNRENSDLELDNSLKNIIYPKALNGRHSSNQHVNEILNEKQSFSLLHDSNESSPEKKSRKIRYYIREYTDISTVSDNENMYRRVDRNDDSVEKETNLNQADLDILVDKAMEYAHCISNNAKRIRKKLYYRIF